MLLLRKLYLTTSMLTVILAATLLMSCYDYDKEDVRLVEAYERYINLSISVSTDNHSLTRAGEIPAWGEDGDGREAGFERENSVTGVTVILYQGTGINSSDAGSTTIDFCAYYPVTLESCEEQGTNQSPHKDEAIYSTGDRSIKGTAIDITNSYHIIVVANMNLASQIEVGTTTLASVREMLASKVCDGTGKGIDATNFVMASEEDDVTIDFPATTPTLDGTNRLIYNFSDIRIERLAARIDFWTNYGTTVEYKAKEGSGTDVDGYEFKVYKNSTEATPTSNDIFKLVAVVPFNVNAGNEYYIKRISAFDNFAARTSETPLYLSHETGTSWVLDCYSNAAKTVSVHPANQSNTLTAVEALAENDAKWLFMNDVQTVGKKYSLDGKDNIIVGYPKENTIDDNSPLYYYATGMAILGYYYRDGIRDAAHTTKKVYYGYLRHQGESTGSYSAVEATGLSKTETISSLGSRPDMNYGVVRNNIYRISIDRIIQKGQTITLKIEEEKWRHVDNPTIYI